MKKTNDFVMSEEEIELRAKFTRLRGVELLDESRRNARFIKNLAGMRFGRWTVICCTGRARDLDVLEYGIKSGVTDFGASVWKCECDCGVIKERVLSSSLMGHRSLSCGCIRLEGIQQRCTGVRRRNEEIYSVWVSMRSRCNNPKATGWKHYGGRGIKVCERWNEFTNFVEDMGVRPSDGHSIDRINNGGHYEPDNCKWSTRDEQASNKRNNLFFDYNGERLTLAAICKLEDVEYVSVYQRIKKYGDTHLEAINVIRSRGLVWKDRFAKN